MEATNLQSPVPYDLVSHHTSGDGSYVFKKDYPHYIKSLLPHPESHLEINILIPPDSSPHAGTLCTLGLAFMLAHRMRAIGIHTMIVCDWWNMAKGDQVVINGITYLRGLSNTRELDEFLPDYEVILSHLYQIY